MYQNNLELINSALDKLRKSVANRRLPRFSSAEMQELIAVLEYEVEDDYYATTCFNSQCAGCEVHMTHEEWNRMVKQLNDPETHPLAL